MTTAAGRAAAAAAALLVAGCVSRPAWDPQPRRIALVDVHVVPMEHEGEAVLPHRTVLVTDGRIEAIGPVEDVAVPADAIVVRPGAGTWLVPGLHDMHVHLLSDDRIDPDLAERELDLLLANGITTARLAIGRAGHLELRRRIDAGELVGPSLVVASPQLVGESPGDDFAGFVVTTPEEGEAAVRAAAEQGYDEVKLTYWIRPEVYDAVVTAAHEVGLPVIGHVGPAVGLQLALAAGQEIEHLDQFLEALIPAGSNLEGSVSGLGVWEPDRWESLELLDPGLVPVVARETAEAGVWCTPTLFFLNACFGEGRTDAEVEASPDARFVSEEVRRELLAARDVFWADPPTAQQRARYVALRNEITRALQEAGVGLMAGSECPEWMLLEGFSLHRELQSLVAAGLTPWQALATATRNPATWLGRIEESGTVTVGKRADLVLLGGDPLVDVASTARVEGVLVQGRWLGRRRLDALLDRAAAELSRAPLER